MADNLVCGETSESWIIDNDDEIDGFTKQIDYNHQIYTKVDNFIDNRSISIMDSCSSCEEQIIDQMITKEILFLPGNDYVKRLRSKDFEFLVRNQVLDWILKVCVHYQFGPSCIYLSMNYLDRFLTSYELPKDKAWAIQLLAVSCLSLAAKIEESNMPQIVDLQVGDPKFVFEAKTITRMELLVLNTLNWRLQSLTPFSFIDYFINKITNNQLLSQNFINRSSQFILNSIKDIEFLDFKPSEIAAAVAVYVSLSGESKIEKAILILLHVEKERVKKCMNLLRIRIEKKGFEGKMVPESPIGVLEVRCLSYRSEERRVESCSCTNSTMSSQEEEGEEENNKNKRRKIMRD